jgi:hypothetical protein
LTPAPSTNGTHATNGEGLRLLPQHLNELRASGLGDEAIRRARLYSEDDPGEVARLLNRSRKYAQRLGACLVFPYPGRAGEPTGYSRLKPTSPQPAKGTKPRLKKYEAPYGQGNRAYFTQLALTALGDPAAELLVTEGEKKGLSAAQAGFPTIAIPGVWNWCKKRRKGPDGKGKGPFELIDDLAGVAWRGRRVCLVFDRDPGENKAVQAAERVFAGVLAEQGATVRMVRLPEGPAGPDGKPTKCGVDDYLVARGVGGPAALRALVEAAEEIAPRPRPDGADGSKSTSSGGERQKLTQAEVLLSLAAADEHWHATDGRAYATVRVEENGQVREESLPVRGKDYRQWLGRRFFQETGKAISVGTLQDVLGVLEARARYEGREREVFCRVGQGAGRLYIDLCDRRWRVVEVDAGGWRVLDASPVRFRRARGMLPLPLPERGGSLNDLRDLLNLGKDDTRWWLVVGWMVQSWSPTGPYPVLDVHGEQGSAKSTFCRMLRGVLDPNQAPLRTVPRDERDLVIAATNSWLLALDNLSHIEPWLADALCRLATGGGYATRELYSDSEEVIFDAQRPVLLNGIEELCGRPDLLDRAVVLQLPGLDEDRRLPERELRVRYEAARPRIVGGLLDALAGALRHREQVRLARLPRMADFATLAVAAGRGLGWQEGAFLAAYAGNRDDQIATVLDSSPIYADLRQLVPDGRTWEGTAAELLEALRGVAGDRSRSRLWPQTPRALSGALRRLTPTLRRAGIRIEFGRTGHNRQRSIHITPGAEESCVQPSASSASSPASQECGQSADGRDRQSSADRPQPSAVDPGFSAAADRANGADGQAPTSSGPSVHFTEDLREEGYI